MLVKMFHGFCMALADSVPGVSGGTVAFILGFYEKFIDAGIPHYTGADSFALNGAFVGYGVDYANLGQKTVDMIADILVDNADPSKTAVETFDNGTATVNTETCKALGFDFDTVKKAFEPLCTQVNEITTAESFDEVESK